MPTYDFACPECESTTVEFFKIADRPETIPCACGGTAKFRISTPAIMSTALPDGTKRPGWDKMREASKLNKAIANSTGETKKDLQKQLRKMNVRLGDST